LVTLRQAECLLQTYSLTDILEINEVSEEEALVCLVNHELVTVPNPKPCDFEDVL